MPEKLHNFQFPNEWKWSGWRTPTRSPSLIHHSPLKYVIPERVHVPYTLSTMEEEALGRLERMDSRLGGDEVKKHGLVIKLPGKSNLEIKEVVKGKEKEVVVSMEKNVEKKDGKQAEKEKKVTDFNDGIHKATVKSWKLWSGTSKSLNMNMCGNVSKVSGSTEKGKSQCQSPTSNVKASCSGSGGGEKVRLTIETALTQREIDEDYFAFGLKTPRKPKKRPKKLQNIIDRLVPRNNLVNISEETYYVFARSMKKHG